jgi:hypothetical protein
MCMHADNLFAQQHKKYASTQTPYAHAIRNWQVLSMLSHTQEVVMCIALATKLQLYLQAGIVLLLV